MQKFKKIIPIELAFWLFFGASCLALFYHALIITQIVPYANAWGGRLPNLQAMYFFETFSFFNQLLFIGLAYAKYKNIGSNDIQKIISIIFYIIFIILLLNTIGNIFAKSQFESLIFTPITLLIAFATLRLAQE